MFSDMKKYIHHLQSVDKDHKRIVRGLFLVSIFVFIGKIAGAAKEVAIAYKFGIGELVDLFVLAFTFAVWLPGIFAAVINTVYVPLVHKLEPPEKQYFKEQFIGITLVFSGLTALILIWLFPYALEALSSNWTLENREQVQKLALGFAPLASLGLISAAFSAMLLAEEHHTNTLLEVIPSLVLTVFVLLWPISQTIDPLLWGTVVGFSMQTIGLFFLLKSAKISTKPTFSFSSPGWTMLKQNIGVVLLAHIIMSFVDPVGIYIASTLGTGNASGLGYSTRILSLFLTLGATAVGRAILPVLSNSERNTNNHSKLAIQWGLILFATGLVAAVITWLITPQLVRVLLERGAFTAEDSASVSTAVRIGVLQFPFYFAGIVLAQFFISIRKFNIILISAIIALSMKVVFSLILSPMYSYGGIILASTPMYLSTNLLFVFCLIRQRKQLGQVSESNS